jgi:SAM-dependent methyltransferase
MDLVEVAPDNGNRHPWELSRRDSLLRLLAELGPLDDVADVGAGDRFFTWALREKAQGRVYAVDIHYTHTGVIGGIQTARTVEELADGGLDCVVLMDVLEHVEDEGVLLRCVRRKLRPNGIALVTVPAFHGLFSAHDIHLKHFRRYQMRQLRDVLQLHGFEVAESFHFYASLYVVRVIQTVIARIVGHGEQRGIGDWAFGLRHPFTVAPRALLDLDYRLCRAATKMGLAVPGLSLCAVCENKSA